MHVPRTAGGLIAFVLMSILMTMAGLYVINRFQVLQNIVAKRTAA